MSGPTTTTAEHDAAAHAEGADHHPSDLMYIKIALLLAFLTAIEVSTYYVDFGKAFLPVLMVLMVIKFLTVAMFFMHLRFDAKLFGRLFWAGLILALGVYVAALTTFQFWTAGV